MNLKINKFITSKQIKQLIFYSNNDQQIIKFTHDSQRFKDLNSFNKWFSNDIQLYTLTNKSNELLGLIWIKPKLNKLSKFKHTFAIRIYNPLRGQGFSYKFAKKVFKMLKMNGVWLSTNKNNQAALKLYSKLKFKKVGQDNDQFIMELSL